MRIRSLTLRILCVILLQSCVAYTGDRVFLSSHRISDKSIPYRVPIYLGRDLVVIGYVEYQVASISCRKRVTRYYLENGLMVEHYADILRMSDPPEIIIFTLTGLQEYEKR